LRLTLVRRAFASSGMGIVRVVAAAKNYQKIYKLINIEFNF
jgi:hypothetical protein